MRKQLFHKVSKASYNFLIMSDLSNLQSFPPPPGLDAVTQQSTVKDIIPPVSREQKARQNDSSTPKKKAKSSDIYQDIQGVLSAHEVFHTEIYHFLVI